MKRFFLLICILCLQLIVFASGNGTVLRCQDAHTGTFNVYSNQMKILVKRDKDFQYEYVNGGSIKYKLKWETECTYTLELLSTNIPEMKQFIGSHYTTTIDNVEKGHFNFTCTKQHESREIHGYMIKVTE